MSIGVLICTFGHHCTTGEEVRIHALLYARQDGCRIPVVPFDAPSAAKLPQCRSLVVSVILLFLFYSLLLCTGNCRISVHTELSAQGRQAVRHQ